jgi:outer membrane receptor for ferrienterochelin and colicins
MTARFSQEFGSRWTLRLSGDTHSEDQNSVAESETNILDQRRRIRIWNGNAGLEFRWTPQRTFLLKTYGTRYRDASDTMKRDSGAIADQNITIEEFLKSEMQFRQTSERSRFTVGGEGARERIESARVTGQQRTATAHSLYVQEEWKLVTPLTLLVGGRTDVHSEFGTHFSPKAGIMWTPNAAFRARLSYGQGFRAPDFKDLYLNFTNAAVGYSVQGNPDLKPETSTSWDVGVEYRLPRVATLRLQAYHNELTDLIDAQRIGRNARGGSLYEYRNRGKAFTRGVEAELERRVTRILTASVGYASLDAQDRTTGLPLLNRSRHSGNLKLAYKANRIGFRADLLGRYVGRRGFYSDGDEVLEPEEYAPGYWMWDVRAAKRFRYGELFVGVQNLFDYLNPTFETFTGREIYGGLELTY